MRPCRTGLYFYSRPCGRGDFTLILNVEKSVFISTHAPAGGATSQRRSRGIRRAGFLLTPLREGRLFRVYRCPYCGNFYSRPCGRGDCKCLYATGNQPPISTHAPAGGATVVPVFCSEELHFYSRPCGRGDQDPPQKFAKYHHFYSRPCGRGDFFVRRGAALAGSISTHAPAGGATGRCC